MVPCTAIRLSEIFKKDYSAARLKAAYIEGNGKYYNNKDAALIRKHNRLVTLFNITKSLYVEFKYEQKKQALCPQCRIMQRPDHNCDICNGIGYIE